MSGLDFVVDPPILNAGGGVYAHCPSGGGAGGGTQPYPEALAAGMPLWVVSREAGVACSAMDLTPATFSGAEYLRRITEVMRNIRLADPVWGVWEAADFQWWWRRERRADTREQLFWLDPDRRAVAAAIVTDWGGRYALDVVAPRSLAPTSGSRGPMRATPARPAPPKRSPARA